MLSLAKGFFKKDGMLKHVKSFLKEEDGMGVIEIVIIIAVLVTIALVFRERIFGFFEAIIDRAFPTDEIDDDDGWTVGETGGDETTD